MQVSKSVCVCVFEQQPELVLTVVLFHYQGPPGVTGEQGLPVSTRLSYCIEKHSQTLKR